MNNLYILILLCVPLSVSSQTGSREEVDLNNYVEIDENYTAPKNDHDGPWKYYYKSGAIEAFANYRYGKLNGDFQSYYKNGLIKSEGHYKDNKRKGFWQFYYENGQIKKKGNYRYGKLRGYFRSYYQNGQLQSEGNFIDIEERQGLWQFYYENGQLKEEHLYKDGILVSKKWFDEDGNGPFEPNDTRLGKYTPLLRPMSWIK